jgi:hypothetical protein
LRKSRENLSGFGVLRGSLEVLRSSLEVLGMIPRASNDTGYARLLLEGMGVAIISGDRRIFGNMPQEYFTYGGHHSFFHNDISFMYL